MPKPIKLDPAVDVVIEVKANYKEFPHLQQYKGIIWKYAGDKSNDEVTQLLSKTWSDYKLAELDAKNNKYTLTMISGKKKYDLEVSPAFSARTYEKALATYKREKKKRTLVQNSPYNVKRKVSVSQMGLYNCDIIYQSDRMAVTSDFKVKHGEQLLPSEDMNFFHITGKNNVVVRYSHRKKTNFLFSPSQDSKIVAIMPGNKVAVLSVEEFSKIASKCKSSGLSSYTFNLTPIDGEVTSAADLDKIIASL